MNNEVKIHGYLCKSEPYNDLELYRKPPRRGKGVKKFWTYSSGDEEIRKIVPLGIMPELTADDEPVEVELIMSVKKIGNG